VTDIDFYRSMLRTSQWSSS